MEYSRQILFLLFCLIVLGFSILVKGMLSSVPYKEAQSRRMDIPPHASLDTMGQWWRCDRGYFKNANTCQQIQLPVHARLDSSGNNWECLDAFKRQAEACIPMSLEEKLKQEKDLKEKILQAEEWEQERARSVVVVRTSICVAAYNKCTSTCYSTLYDRYSGRVAKSIDFINSCSGACADGQNGCEEPVDNDPCNAFAIACRNNCPAVIHLKESGQVSSGTNAEENCKKACSDGETRCYYQRTQLNKDASETR